MPIQALPSPFRAALRLLVPCGAALLVAMAVPAGAQGAMPTMTRQGAGQFVCGGIGSDESTAMRAAMKDHPLALLFARADGAYLADVDVSIKDASGAAAMAFRARGPVCLLDLPGGRYTIEAASEGRTKTERVMVGGGSKTADFRF